MSDKSVISDEYFTALVKKALTELSPEHVAALKHVQILTAYEPSERQAEQTGLREGDILLGLFEGVPLTQRSGYESGLTSDTITIFKKGILQVTQNERDMYEQIKRTLWHEMAHYFGLDHDKIHELEDH